MTDFLRSLFPDSGKHVPVIAEMAWAHDGKVNLGKEIIEGAADSKAAAISLHITELKDYMVPLYRSSPERVSNAANVGDVYQYLEKINLRPDQVDELIACAKARKLCVGLMPNDFPSL